MISPLLQKSITVCIIGKPNSGKSTLLNKIIGQKISIVTPKVQTTRSAITGIVTINDTQIILLDTPGIFEAKNRLEKAMVRCAWSSLYSADMVILIIDGTKPLDSVMQMILCRLQTLKIYPVFLINKIDLSSKYLSHITNGLVELFPESSIFQISALQGSGVDKLQNYMISKAKQSQWHYAEDDMTNLPMRFLAAEITREQLFLNLHEELPYKLTVQTENWQEFDNGSVKINQVIIVSRESYKTIILGKNGTKIKEIGENSRKSMESLLDRPVHLFLFVKVRELWENDPDSYRHMRL